MARLQPKRLEGESTRPTEVTPEEAEPYIRESVPYRPGPPRPLGRDAETDEEYFRRRVVEMDVDPETLQPLTPTS
jgi:hypothetical protein